VAGGCGRICTRARNSGIRGRQEIRAGTSDAQIKLGQTMPFSGPASACSVVAKTQAAYFKMINEQGGVTGRKINLIVLDDAYSPPKTVERTRKLVEQEEVAAIFDPLGTATGLAVRKYLNEKKGATALCRPRRDAVTGSRALSVVDRLSAVISGRDCGLRKVCAEEQARRQDRAVLPERRRPHGLGQRLSRTGSGPKTPLRW